MTVAAVAAGAMIGTAVGGSTSGLLNPLTRDLSYISNYYHARMLPSLRDAYESYLSGRFNFASMNTVGLYHGAQLQGINILTNQYQRINGVLTQTQLAAQTESNAWIAAAQLTEYRAPLQLTLEMLNRGLISDKSADWWIKRLGVPDPLMRAALRDMQYVIPGPQELIRLAVREAFADPKTIANLQLDAEYPDEYARWAKRVGFGPIVLTDPATQKPEVYDFAKGYWRAHWQLPSASQAYSMFHRLRPTGGPAGGTRDPSGEVFTQQNLKDLLKVLDFSPLWRGKLAAISYIPMPVRVLRRSIQYGYVNAQEAFEYCKDYGYNDRDAAVVAKTYLKDARLSSWLNIAKVSRGKIEEAYRIGTIDRGSATELLQQHGLDADEVKFALQAIDLELQTTLIKEAIKGIRQKVLGGIITLQEGSGQLSQLGIDAQAAGRYATLWSIYLASPRVTLTAGKICELVGKGFLSPIDAKTRLLNLGFRDSQADEYLLPCEQAWIERQQRAAVDILKAQEKAAKKVADAIKAKKRALREAQSELSRHSSPSMLEKWLSEGLISVNDATARLTFLGWPQDDIDRLVQEAADKAAAKSKGGKGGQGKTPQTQPGAPVPG